MAVAQNLRARVTQVLAHVSTCQGSILVPFFGAISGFSDPFHHTAKQVRKKKQCVERSEENIGREKWPSEVALAPGLGWLFPGLLRGPDTPRGAGLEFSRMLAADAGGFWFGGAGKKDRSVPGGFSFLPLSFFFFLGGGGGGG